jgi:AcrR family transcriptional regulator
MPATRREQMKQNTRQRVMDAARELFAEKGYASATIRDIATKAEVSTGSVFTTFESKEHILSTIVMESQEELVLEIAKAREEAKGDARTRLKSAIAAAYAYEFKRLLLVVEQIGASWTWSVAFENSNRKSMVKPFSFMRELLLEARDEGSLRSDVDLELLGDILLGVYLRNFRHAWFRGWNQPETVQYMNSQIDLIFDGACVEHANHIASRKKA